MDCRHPAYIFDQTLCHTPVKVRDAPVITRYLAIPVLKRLPDEAQSCILLLIRADCRRQQDCCGIPVHRDSSTLVQVRDAAYADSALPATIQCEHRFPHSIGLLGG